MSAAREVFLVRHGEMESSLNGRHTGVSDISLTENVRRVARRWQPVLARRTFALVLTSPLARAQETSELAGHGEAGQVEGDLRGWDYGTYEGLTPQQIHATAPEWMIFRDGCPGGESPPEVGVRVDRLIKRVRAASGNVALFAHGHVLRVLAARWLGLSVASGSDFLLDTATVSVLSFYRSGPAIKHWKFPLLAVDSAEFMHLSAPGSETCNRS